VTSIKYFVGSMSIGYTRYRRR